MGSGTACGAQSSGRTGGRCSRARHRLHRWLPTAPPPRGEHSTRRFSSGEALLQASASSVGAVAQVAKLRTGQGTPAEGLRKDLPGERSEQGQTQAGHRASRSRHSAQTPARRKPLTMGDDPEDTLICCCPLGLPGGGQSQANVAGPSARRACRRGGEKTPCLSSRPVGSKSLSSVWRVQS